MTTIQAFQYISLLIVLLSAFIAVIEFVFNNNRSNKPITAYVAGIIAVVFFAAWLVLQL